MKRVRHRKRTEFNYRSLLATLIFLLFTYSVIAIVTTDKLLSLGWVVVLSWLALMWILK